MTETSATSPPYVPYVGVHETHTGIVVLAGDRAFKAKKPVLTDFLDFRTPERRERVCLREVELNRRLSPDSYLGVAHLTDPAGGPAEPIVVMRRYHDEDRLAFIVSTAANDDAESVRGLLDTIAAALARFHRRAERGRAISAQGEAGAIDQRWRANLAELDRYAGTLPAGSVPRIRRLAAEFVAGREPLFRQRIEDGLIVDGHGDLLADDIFCGQDEPALLDCLEFDDNLRYVDCVDDAAFLAMDLEFLGHGDLGEHFLQRYAAHSARPAPQSLAHFYIAYRAVVRGKVDCVRLSQGKAAAAEDAARHLAIAVEHLEAGSVRLALVGGNPGTGKSTLARALAEQTGAQVISTDDVRRELRDSGALTGDAGVLDRGLYSPANVAAVYEAALLGARSLLGDGQSVILDGTWRQPQMRALAHRLAAETHSAMVELECAAAAGTAAGRITTRRPGTSEVTPEIAEAMAARHAGWDTAHRIDTSGALEDSAREALGVWRRSSEPPLQRN